MRFSALFSLFSITTTLIVGCSSSKVQSGSGQPNTLSMKEKKDGWVLLFDGNTTNGWHTYNKNFVSNNWKVIDGAIVFDPKTKDPRGNGDLITDDSFENFEFSTEWRISETGNSGIIFDVKEDPKFRATYNTGAEMQVLDNIKAADNKKENHLAGLLYDLYGTANLSKPKPVGEWNVAQIIQKKGHLTFYFNGTKTLDTQVGGAEWNTMVENSKFKTWPNFMKSASGKIAFQNHDHEVAFRNVKIRKL